MNLPDPVRCNLERPFSNHRESRFGGSGFEVLLEQFAAADRELLKLIYRAVHGFHTLRLEMGDHPDDAILTSRIHEIGKGETARAACALGVASRVEFAKDGPRERAVHDIRGGALTLLLGASDLLEFVPDQSEFVSYCVYAATDHCKIVRSLVPELDPSGWQRDRLVKPHYVDRFVKKMDGATIQGPTGPIDVTVESDYFGGVAASCLESSSIDRLLYNFMNNAVRYASDRRVELQIELTTPRLTRWVMRNRITPEQAGFLRDRVGGDALQLFAGGITNGGSGLGLSNCVQIVAECFGLRPCEKALEGAYLGAASHGSDFYAWFHWPALAELPATG